MAENVTTQAIAASSGLELTDQISSQGSTTSTNDKKIKHDQLAEVESLESRDPHQVDGLDDGGYKRELTVSQIIMITFGAGIGTGLWVSTGQALAKAGPAGCIIAYSVLAVAVIGMYMSIGEMTAFKPVHGGFIRQTQEYVDPAWAFALGLNFTFEWIIVLPAEVTAAINIIKFWDGSQKVPEVALIVMFLISMITCNLFPVRAYGHTEYWMSSIKLLALFAVMIYMLIATCGGTPGHGPIGFRYFHAPEGKAFNNSIKGIAAALVQAGFSMGGGEHIAVAAGEAKDPRRAVKKAVAPICLRMIMFFIVNIFLVTLNTAYNDPRLVNAKGTLASPFVIAILNGGTKWFAHIINAFILLTVISCGNSGIYIASRCLVSCSKLGLVPAFLGRTDAHGRPRWALAIVIVLGSALCFLNLSATGVVVYGWFSSLVSNAGFICWLSIFVTHIRFRRGLKAQGIDAKSELPFRDYFAPYTQWIGTVVILVILIAECYLAIFPIGGKPSAKHFFSSYITIPLFIFDFIAYKLWFRSKFVRAKEMDFSEAKYFTIIDDRLREMEKIREESRGVKPADNVVIRSLKGFKTMLYGS
ncbi:amino acid transporter [Violaceomyces palustris]|uniref:Amino acid transporter n=1 Tax=Violaceomyces palustris TaxID=1673888 RepID=A0ACD0NXT0_9BASI|nr:amino acid transporter [Violaceomyces palustris]